MPDFLGLYIFGQPDRLIVSARIESEVGLKDSVCDFRQSQLRDDQGGIGIQMLSFSFVIHLLFISRSHAGIGPRNCRHGDFGRVAMKQDS